MNATTSRSWLAWRFLGRLLLGTAALFLLATVLAASQQSKDHSRSGGGSPYTPTKGEWLCLLLNARQALLNSERTGAGVAPHYLYDRSNPDTIRVQVAFGEGVDPHQVRLCENRAEQQVLEAAQSPRLEQMAEDRT